MYKTAANVALLVFGTALVSAGFNLFMIPHSMLAGGISGVAMLVGYMTGWNIALLYFVLNLPVIVWGWIAIGKRFIYMSVVSVLVTTWLMRVIPTNAFVTEPLIAAVFGGVVIGIGSGLCLRAGGSTGGFDIVGSIVTRRHDFPLGTVLFILNGAVVLLLGYFNSWDLALSSMLSIYIAGKTVDMIHVRHVKVTVFVITRSTEAMLRQLMPLERGVTVMRTRGAFTNAELDMLMTVTTRYELAELKRIIRQTDPKAFVNIVETVAVMGEFRKK